MKFSKYITLSLAIIAAFSTSCSFRDDLRVDPTLASDVPMWRILPAVQVGLGYTAYSDIGRVNSYWTQQYNGDYNQQNAASLYIFLSSDVDNMWNNYYTYLYSNEIMMTKAKAQDAPHFQGIGEVLKAMTFGTMTSLWGDIPFSQALKATDSQENLQPTYDKQENIYPALQVLLDSAIVHLSKSESKFTPDASQDLVYGGNMDNWIAAAHAIKARLYLHVRNKQSNAATLALQEIDKANFSSTSDFLVKFEGAGITTQAPLFQFIDQRGDMGTSKTYTDTLVKYNDPRTLFLVDTSNGGVGGFELISGAIPGSAGDAENCVMGSYIASANTPSRLLTYEEVKFIEAEAAFASGDLTRASTAYNDAVKASVLSITGSSDAAFEGAVASDTSSSITLQKIMVQKWIALPLQSEVFTDWRRTGFPALSPVDNAQNDGVIPRRWPYPSGELNLNKANVPDEGIRPLQTKVWWDK